MATKYNAGMDINRKGPKYNEQGEEMMDPTPVALPMAFRRPESISDMMKRLVRTHLSRVAAAEQSESFDEADDFNVDGEEKEPNTPYEDDLEGVDRPAINEPAANTAAFKKKLKAAERAGKKEDFLNKAEKRYQNRLEKAGDDEMLKANAEKQRRYDFHEGLEDFMKNA